MQPKTHPAIASQHYRMLDLQSRVASASPHGLVGLLYEELLRSLDLIIAKQANGQVIAGSADLVKALSIIVALEGSLVSKRVANWPELWSGFIGQQHAL